MFETNFGIEVEFSEITRKAAAEIVAKAVNGEIRGHSGYEIYAEDRRIWKVVYDSSVGAYQKQGGRVMQVHDDNYRCEIVSPILTYYRDISIIQTLVRKLRKEGAIAPDTAGIHIHLDGANHTPQTIKNFVNIITSSSQTTLYSFSHFMRKTLSLRCSSSPKKVTKTFLGPFSTCFTRLYKSRVNGRDSAKKWMTISYNGLTWTSLAHLNRSPTFGTQTTPADGIIIITIAVTIF